MHIDPAIFRAYDIRGVVGTQLTEDAVEQIGRALGSECYARGSQRIVVGRDGRLSGPMLQAALMRGLTASGMQVLDVGSVPTPVVYFAMQALDADSCVAVTGSHNPPDYNGLKMVAAGETLSAEAITDLLRRIQEQDLYTPTEQGAVASHNVLDAYVERISDDVKLARPMRVVLDCGNGIAGMVAKRLFETLGCEVLDCLYCEVDGTFPNHHPDPSKPENLEDLKVAMQRTGAEIGLAFDGDGDRLGVVDASGAVIFPDRQMMLFARDILARNPGAEIVYDVKCTRNLADVIAQAGGQPTMWRTGHSFIKKKLKETPNALLAGEMSGHVFFKERWYGFDDGLYTGARLLEILAKDARTPAEIFSALPDTVNTPEINLSFAEGAHYAFMASLTEVAEFADAEVVKIDGLRVDWAHGWGLVRPSNTTPVLVFRFEAESVEALGQVQAVFREQLRRVDPQLELPF
jgi:phosphomannomutase/phosphoglucomutase